MKRWFICVQLLLILFGGFAHAQTRMVITFKDGREEVIDLSTILRIEHQKTEPSSLSKDADFHYKQGISLYGQKRYFEAIEAFSNVIAIHPFHSESWRRRGLVRYMLMDYAGASIDCARSLELDLGNARAYNLRGLIKEKLKDYLGAIEDYKRATELDASYIGARVNLANLMTETGDPPAALRIVETILRVRPDNLSALEARAYARLKMKDYFGAIEDYDNLIAKNPNTPYYYNNRGLAKRDIYDLTGARKDFEKALEIDPADEKARANLSKLPRPDVKGQVPRLPDPPEVFFPP